jgi:hypothetical protein
MNNNSFYGGRDGRSMVIAKNYLTVEDMLKDFSGLESINPAEPASGNVPGKTGLGVNFGDYVIIETINRNNPENGRIFRRNFNFNDTRNKVESWHLNAATNIYERKMYPCYGAEYISQIVGPSGNAPHLHLLSTKAEVDEQYANFENKPGYDVKIGSDDSEASTNELGLGNLVPGKDGDDFNDKITWRYCSVRDENQQETDAYIGFEIPYTVIEWDAHSENPYYNRSNNTNDFINTDLITRHDEDKDAEHPFYQKWQIHIPKGIHGQSIENLRVDTDAEGREVLKYEFRNYDAKPEGETQTIELGDYNMIDNITIDDNGTITIQYSHDDDFVKEKLLTWITEVNLSPTGKLNIKTNNHNEGTEIIDEQLQWVKDITFNEKGTVVLHYIDGTTSENTYENLIDWIKSIKIAQDGTVSIVSNNGTELLDSNQSKLKWVEGVALEQDGTFKQTYNNGETTPQQATKLKWATNIKVSDNGTITTEYNNGEPQTQGPTMDWITSATLTNDKKLSINYVHAKNIENLDLKTVNNITFANGSMYANYNDGTSNQYIGSIDNATVNMIAGDESIDTSNLRIGGIWFEVIEG